jgi:hypothetical protein
MAFSAIFRTGTPPLILVLHPQLKKPRDNVRFEVREVDAEGRLRFEEGPMNLANSGKRATLIRRIANALGLTITDSELLTWLQDYRQWLANPDGAKGTGAFTITIRHKHGVASSGQPFVNADPIAALKAALEAPVAESDLMIEWPTESEDRLVMLDVDYHNLTERASDEYLTAIAANLRPQPACWWISHGGGVHAIYATVGTYTAKELAACAAFSIRQLDTSCTTELLTHTRHPKSPRTTS